MTDRDKGERAPGRIWLDLPTYNGAVGFAHDRDHKKGGWPEYVRADLFTALQERNALLEATIEGMAVNSTALQAERDALREALEFYADQNYDGYDIDYGLSTQGGPIIRDGGEIARSALHQTERDG